MNINVMFKLSTNQKFEDNCIRGFLKNNFLEYFNIMVSGCIVVGCIAGHRVYEVPANET